MERSGNFDYAREKILTATKTTKKNRQCVRLRSFYLSLNMKT